MGNQPQQSSSFESSTASVVPSSSPRPLPSPSTARSPPPTKSSPITSSPLATRDRNGHEPMVTTATPPSLTARVQAALTTEPPDDDDELPHRHNLISPQLERSFNNWQGKIPMQRSDDLHSNHFTLCIDIPPGTHQYKYIVDEAWRLDPIATQTVSQGVANNVIEVKPTVFEDTRVAEQELLNESDDELDENKNAVSYGQRVPKDEEYIKDPLKIPPHLTQIMLNTPPPLDSHVLPIPSHVTLNHLYVYSGQHDASVMVTGLTQRFKLKRYASLMPKYVTTVFYCPRPAPSS